MMFFPFEKIPVFIWGILLAFIMSFLAFYENLFAEQQAVDVGLAILGISAAVFDIRKRIFSYRTGTSAKT